MYYTLRDRQVSMRLPSFPIWFACVAALFPHPAAGQRVFAVESEVAVRADSFACKETSELDRLLQRNQSGGFTGTTVRLSQGAQMHWSDRGPCARVFVPRPIRLHLRSEKQQGKHLSLRLDANRDAVEMVSSGPSSLSTARQTRST